MAVELSRRTIRLAGSQVPTFSCQLTTPAGCYGPAQIRAAYGVDTLLGRGDTGAGETITIIDAFQSPTITQDLATFDSLFGIPAPTLNIIAPDGLTPFDQSSADQTSWAGEITLDVEHAHAIAPGATIDLVLGTSAGSPRWAGLTALADQLAGHRVGYLNNLLYTAAHSGHQYAALFHDVTAGDNTFHGPVTVTGYAATPGWDPATGLGSPQANRLVPLLAG